MTVLATTAVFKITDVWFGAVKNVRMYFDVGLPASNGTLFDDGIQLTPKFVGLLNTITGSPGGSTIVLNVQGVGRNDTVSTI